MVHAPWFIRLVLTTHQQGIILDTVIALDVGHSAVKVVVNSPLLPQGRHSLLFPSVANSAIELSEPKAREAAARETVNVDGRSFFFGETAVTQGTSDSESGLSDNWITTPQYAALALGAFQKLRQMPTPISTDGAIVVVGLPAKFFAQQKPTLHAIMQKLAPHALIVVLPQPMGPFMCVQFNDDGTESRNHKMSSESWGIIEIGHYTTDFGVVRDGNWIDKNSGSCRGGHVLVDQVVARVREERGYTLSLIEATRAVCDGWFKDYGSRIPVQPYIASSATILTDEVMDTVSRLLDKDARTLDGIVVAGGAAPLLYPVIHARYQHAVMAENSRMTVAEGFCRFGCAYRNDRKVQRNRAAQSAAVAA